MKKSSRRSRRHRNPKSKEGEQQTAFFSKTSESKIQAKEESGFFQPKKLEVSGPNDPAEKEADAVAKHVVHSVKQQRSATVQKKDMLHRAAADKEEPAAKLQRMAEPKAEPKAKLQKMEDKQEEPTAKLQRAAEKEEPTAKLQRAAEKEEPKAKLQRMEDQQEEPTAKLQRAAEKEEPTAKLQRAAEKEEPKAKLQRMEDKQEEPTAKLQRAAEKEEPNAKLQRAAEKEEPTAKLQAKKDSRKKVKDQKPGPKDSSTVIEQMIQETKGKGFALPNDIKAEMEGQFHVDFSNVRIHTNINAIKMCNMINAQAFTHGFDIYFNDGKYNPDTDTGKNLLAHELTHVVQQKGG